MSDNEQGYVPPVCEHHWVSRHQPGLPLYWIDQCSQCGTYNAERMWEEVVKAAVPAKMVGHEWMDGHPMQVILPQPAPGSIPFAGRGRQYMADLNELLPETEVDPDALAGFLSSLAWDASRRMDKRAFWRKRADALLARFKIEERTPNE